MLDFILLFLCCSLLAGVGIGVFALLIWWGLQALKYLLEKINSKIVIKKAREKKDEYTYYYNWNKNFNWGQKIEDISDIWTDVTEYLSIDTLINKVYQCKVRQSLFKTLYNDGSVKYYDTLRFRCINILRGNKASYELELINTTLSEKFPIIMPYTPDKPHDVYCELFLTDEKNGDFDTVGILYTITPSGVRFDVGRYYKEDKYNRWVEITEKEYHCRKEGKIL